MIVQSKRTNEVARNAGRFVVDHNKLEGDLGIICLKQSRNRDPCVWFKFPQAQQPVLSINHDGRQDWIFAVGKHQMKSGERAPRIVVFDCYGSWSNGDRYGWGDRVSLVLL